MMKSLYLLILLFLSVSAKPISCNVLTEDECSFAFANYEGEIDGSPSYGCRWEFGYCVNADKDYCENMSLCRMPCLKVNDKCTHLLDVESCSNLVGPWCESLYSMLPSKGLKCVNVEGTCSDLLVNCTSITNKVECLEYPHHLSCIWTNLSKATGSNCIDVSSVTNCSIIEAAGEDNCSILSSCHYLNQSQKCVSKDNLTSCPEFEDYSSCRDFRSFPNVQTLYGCIYLYKEKKCSDATKTTCEEEDAWLEYSNVCTSNGDHLVNMLSINNCGGILNKNTCSLDRYLSNSPTFENKKYGCFWNDTFETCEPRSGNCSKYDYDNCEDDIYNLCFWNGDKDDEDKCVLRASITECGHLTSPSACSRGGWYDDCVWNEEEESCQKVVCGEYEARFCMDSGRESCLVEGNECKPWNTTSIQRCSEFDNSGGCSDGYIINLFCDWKYNREQNEVYCYDENIGFKCNIILSEESCWSFQECSYLNGSCVNREVLHVSCSNLSFVQCNTENIKNYLDFPSSRYGCIMTGGKCAINYTNCSEIEESEQCSFSKSEFGIPTDKNVVCRWVVEEGESKCEKYTDNCRASTKEETCTSNDCFWNSNTCVSKEWITNCAQILGSSSLCTDDENTFENLIDKPCFWDSDSDSNKCHPKSCSDLNTLTICNDNSSCVWFISGNTDNGICKVKQSLKGSQEVLSEEQCNSQFINEKIPNTTNTTYVWNSESDTVTSESGKQPCKRKSDLYACILIERKSLCIENGAKCSWNEDKCISKSKPDSDSTSVPCLSAFVVLVSMTFLFIMF